ncbi:putative siderophore transport system permease protein YfiZ [Starkeya nomas]|uniref:Putative siderophore transport system permease protein YfiZ n=1 Tax=Starkeya nomas TaxID=2666134 RepID=A0A5S9Q5Y7_9HYPH|nr:putative siderophore transport system permease protein YfiZ [Starkeya nomas]
MSAGGNRHAAHFGTREAVIKRRALLALLAALVIVAFLAATAGTTAVPSDVWGALFAFDGSREHLVITHLRLPRVLAGMLTGAALAVAGAIMQAATNNPLAAPDLLGVNAGAAFGVVSATTLLGVTSDIALVGYALGGTGMATLVVFLLGVAGPSGATPVRLVLAGAVLTAFLSSLTTAMLIFDQSTLDQIRLWLAGSLYGLHARQVAAIAPFILAALAVALLLRAQFTTLSLGGDVAQSLGQRPLLWRGISVALVMVLAGSAIALAGPIAFVGLVVPHVIRFIVGTDYRWILPFSALGGALLLLLADTCARLLFGSQGFPVGAATALIGAPFFVWLARNRAGCPA